ncbi:MAG: hypothetical protein V4496_02010 [Pseudomonadota bacterium]
MSDFEQLTQKYKKKVEVVDDRSTPEARAARVKRLRNLANLSRKQMCEGNDINVNTLKGWEIARYGGLPLDGAHKIIKRVSQEGVLCTVEWLLYEDGPPPSVNVGQAMEQSAPDAKKKSEAFNLEEEMTLFQQHYPSAIQYAINDDGMLPFYEVGDVVAGIKKSGKHINDLLETNCIVQLANGQLYCRRLRKGKLENTYHLVCFNTETSLETPIMTDVELLSAARIIWHRKQEENFNPKTKIATHTFIKQITHDLCSPAAGLRMLIDDEKKLSKDQREFIEHILVSINAISDKLTKKG